MKKLVSLLLLFAFITSFGMAQVPAKTTSGGMASGAVHAKQSMAGMKKDGTPDKRYKANQKAKPMVAGPMKKDGTPDMRYKKNKKAMPK